jgi:prophage maintenance system killer protein
MATETFLMLNGYELNIDNELLAVVFLELADGKYSRDDMEEMIRGWLIREAEDSL